MSYWKKQTSDAPLFPHIEWNKPQRRGLAGKLGIIGGNKLSFASAADSYDIAINTGVGEARVLLPDALRKMVPASMTDVVFGDTTPSGGLSSEASGEVRALSDWADVVLLSGDAGKNSQTAVVYEELVKSYQKPIVITRDAADLIQNSYPAILDNPNACLIISFSQLQRVFRAVYYPKVLTFSMQLAQFVETLHKFTLTYPLTILTLHADQIIIARDGQVVTQSWQDPMRIWRGHTAAKGASYLVWNPKTPLEALTTSIFS